MAVPPAITGSSVYSRSNVRLDTTNDAEAVPNAWPDTSVRSLVTLFTVPIADPAGTSSVTVIAQLAPAARDPPVRSKVDEPVNAPPQVLVAVPDCPVTPASIAFRSSVNARPVIVAVFSAGAEIKNVRSTVPPGTTSPEKLFENVAFWPPPILNVAEVPTPVIVAPLIVPLGAAVLNVIGPLPTSDGTAIPTVNVQLSLAAMLPLNRVRERTPPDDCVNNDDPAPHGLAGKVSAAVSGSGG